MGYNGRWVVMKAGLTAENNFAVLKACTFRVVEYRGEGVDVIGMRPSDDVDRG